MTWAGKDTDGSDAPPKTYFGPDWIFDIAGVYLSYLTDLVVVKECQEPNGSLRKSLQHRLRRPVQGAH